MTVKLCEVSKVYSDATSGQVTALRPTSLVVLPEEYVAIVGPSGSGKSTLLSIAGLLTTPTKGSVSINGISVSDLDDGGSKLRRDEIGYVFQDFNLLDHLTAVSNVMEALRFTDYSTLDRRELAVSALAQVGMTHRKDHRPRQMSGGEQQRVAIARALVKSPSIVLADEPTGNLDVKTTEVIASLLERIARKSALIMVTHDTEIAQRADRVVTVSPATIRGPKE